MANQFPIPLSQFAAAYRAMRGWRNAAWQAAVDEELTPYYPVCLYQLDGQAVVTVAPDLEEAVQPLEELDPHSDFTAIIDFLFTHISYQQERALGLYLPTPLSPLPGGRPLSGKDGPALAQFAARVGASWAAGEVTLEDDITFSIWDGAQLAAVGGARVEGGLGDLSVCVHPGRRGKGLGKQVVAALCALLQERGILPLYRCEETNAPSLALARSLGFTTGFVLTGAPIGYESL